jgi:hypothetical protein
VQRELAALQREPQVGLELEALDQPDSICGS